MKTYLKIFLGLVLGSSPCVYGDAFKFNLRGYPKLERNCHAQTLTVGQEFEVGTQTKVLHVECIAEKKTGYDFLIEYEAPQALNFVSTEYPFNLTDSSGRYREKEECLKQLPTQELLFEQTTLLKPFFAYCRSLELEVGKNWEIILIASGQAELTPHIGGYLMFAKPYGVRPEALVERMRSVLQGQGAVLADLIFHHNSVMGMGSGSVHYFAQKRIEFHLERVSQLTDIAHCLSQVQELEKILSSFSSRVFGLYCGEMNLGYHDLHLGFVNKAEFSWQKSVDAFKTFSECEENRAEVLKHYEGSVLNQLLGGICSRNYETDKYEVIIFKKLKS